MADGGVVDRYGGGAAARGWFRGDRTGSVARRSTAKRRTPDTACSPRTTPRSRPTSRSRWTRRPPSARQRTASDPAERRRAGHGRGPRLRQPVRAPHRAPRARAQRVPELLPHDTTMAELERRGVRAVILSGGPMSVYDKDAPKADASIWSGTPAGLGICYGAQLMAPSRRGRHPGHAARVRSGDRPDHPRRRAVRRHRPRAARCPDPARRLDHRMPKGFHSTAETESTPSRPRRPRADLYGIEFHPEVVHTPRGPAVLRNFVTGIAGIEPNWTPPTSSSRRWPRSASGWTPTPARPAPTARSSAPSPVGSTPPSRRRSCTRGRDRLTCIYVDHGLMREKESGSCSGRRSRRTSACAS